MARTRDFQPDWVSPPGDTVLALLEQKQKTLGDVLFELDLSEAQLDEFLCGQYIIDEKFAYVLARVLGGSKTFWMRRDASYRHGLLRMEELAALDAKSWLQKLPIKHMLQNGWVENQTDHENLYRNCLKFFKINTHAEWNNVYGSIEESLAFKTSPTYDQVPEAVAAWFRRCEYIASQQATATFDVEKLKGSLPSLRALTRVKDPRVFIAELQAICARSGVAVVLVPAPKGCRATAAAYQVNSEKFMIALSLRYKTDDHFWFALFHEIGHILNHDLSAGILEIDGGESELEDEANAFARDILIPEQSRGRLYSIPKRYRDVIRFAWEINIAPGIVVGQMQHMGLLPHNWLKSAKRQIDWASLKDIH